MYTVVESEEFEAWLSGVKDRPTRIRLARRLDKARRGNLGDVKPVGGGVFEMREFFGPGWRMYYFERSGTIIFMLGGGDKSAQESDIERAKRMAQELRNEQDQDPSV
ncbi:putative addiction module killer protein (plasmid) [Variovorax sp. SRS16]|uniref:type II toxin-antitoxin system RelE/ParE family toxin n=1 Tax=Variovorax sp. SRS16 TaxID=282217 RepID=UPI001317F24F|nr:type II toxin-antitoxin system RelE/ParE family toxin [Variovorax sp. SRS16]VTU46075.1 putative addiction module killer protein [Variovorax sp. SRS16]